MLAIAIRRADEDDLPAILALERQTEGAPHWSEAVWREMLMPANGGQVKRAVFVAIMEDGLTGFVVVGGLADAMDLESLAVTEAERGKGIGKALCRSAMAWARENGAESLQLEVRASNAVACAVYRSLGFVEVGRRPRYYRDPEDAAMLMAVTLQGH